MRLGLAIVVAMTAAALAGPASADVAASERKAIAASGLPRTSVVAVKSGMVVAIRDRGAISTAGAIIEGITLQGEVVSSEAAQFLGYRSMRSTVNVDCVRRRDLVVKMTVYSQPGAKGAAVVRQVPGGWAQPSPDAYLAAVIRSVCGGAPPQIAAAAPLPAKDAAEISSEFRLPPPRSRPAPIPADPLPPPSMPEVVGPDQPMRTSVEARYRTPSAQLVSNAAAPELRPAIQPSSPAPKSAPPAPLPAKEAPKPAPKPKPKAAPGKLSVQIAASSSEAQALAALAKIKGKVAPPLSMQVKRVVVDGKTFHRALVSGFGARSEAQAFCSALKGDCFVR